MPRFRSLRFRLALWYSVAGALLLAGFSGTIYAFVATRLASPIDAQLKEELAQIHRQLTVDETGAVYWSGDYYEPGSVWPASRPWFELWSERGRLMHRLWPFSAHRLDRLPPAPPAGREVVSVYTVAPGLRLRTLAMPTTLTGSDATWTVRVMRVHESEVSALRSLLLVLAVALPVVLILLVLGGYAITRRWLAPLDRMVAEADQITAHDLERRLSYQQSEDELGRLAQAFNATLSRLADSFQTLDRFVADAAHELLTPLTTLRSVGEMALRKERPPEAYRESIASMLEESQRLRRLVEMLLELARAEGGATILNPEVVQADELLAEWLEDIRVLADERNQRLTLAASPCKLRTDVLLLRQAVQNLLDNAIKYTPRGGEIHVSAHREAETCEIAVTDTGPGIPREYQHRVTERFFRVDTARDRRSGGTGLGLALTNAYATALGGELHYTARPGGGSVFRLLLPAQISGLSGRPRLRPPPVTARG